MPDDVEDVVIRARGFGMKRGMARRHSATIISEWLHYLDSVPFSGIIRIRDLMYTVDKPFRLDQGDVSFDAPDSVKDALSRASPRTARTTCRRRGSRR